MKHIQRNILGIVVWILVGEVYSLGKHFPEKDEDYRDSEMEFSGQDQVSRSLVNKYEAFYDILSQVSEKSMYKEDREWIYPKGMYAFASIILIGLTIEEMISFKDLEIDSIKKIKLEEELKKKEKETEKQRENRIKDYQKAYYNYHNQFSMILLRELFEQKEGSKENKYTSESLGLMGYLVEIIGEKGSTDQYTLYGKLREKGITTEPKVLLKQGLIGISKEPFVLKQEEDQEGIRFSFWFAENKEVVKEYLGITEDIQ